MTIQLNFRLKESSNSYLICLACLLSTALFSPAAISAYEKTLAWDANDEPDLEGYILYSRVGDPCPPYNYIDTYPEDELAYPLSPRVMVTNFEYNTRYYLVVTAYDTDGYESAYSNVISLYNELWGNAYCSSLNDSLNGGGGGGGGAGCFIASSTPGVWEGEEIITIIYLLSFGLFSFVILKRKLSKYSISMALRIITKPDIVRQT